MIRDLQDGYQSDGLGYGYDLAKDVFFKPKSLPPGLTTEQISKAVIDQLQESFKNCGCRWVYKESLRTLLYRCGVDAWNLRPELIPYYKDLIVDLWLDDTDRVKSESSLKLVDDGTTAVEVLPSVVHTRKVKPVKADGDRLVGSISEKMIQKWLHNSVGGEIEKRVPQGAIDLLTSTAVIEIKRVSDWKGAIGQVLSYGSNYPERRKAIVLFEDGRQFKWKMIFRTCMASNVELYFVSEVDRQFYFYQILSEHQNHDRPLHIRPTEVFN